MYAPADEMSPQDNVLRGHLVMEPEEPQPEHHDPLSALENEQAQDAVRLYLREIGRVPLLKKADEVRLAKAIELQRLIENAHKLDEERERIESDPQAAFEGLDLTDTDIKGILKWDAPHERRYIRAGEEARRQMIEANLRLVVSVAKKYLGHGMSLLDLIQEGNTGLMRAVEKFDWRRGFKFSTYATWWIRQAITRAIADQARTIRIPVHMVETINKLVRTSRRLLQEYGREPTSEEIGLEMDLPADRVREIMKVSQTPVSLETPIGEEEDSNLGDFIPDEAGEAPSDAASYQLLRESMDDVLGSLTERERAVLRLRFGLDDGRSRTLDEVGKEFNVTRERIRQIEAKALRKLRHPSRSRKLRDFLEV